MRKFNFWTLCVSLFITVAITSCGVDHKDPESVANAILKCYVDEDLTGMTKYVDPSNEEQKEGLVKFQEMLEDMKKNGAKATDKSSRPKFNAYSIKSIKDPYGYDLNDFTEELQVCYDCDGGRDITVYLKKVDGKWYMGNRIPQ